MVDSLIAKHLLADSIKGIPLRDDGSRIFHADFRMGIFDQHSGLQFNAVLPSVNGKSVERFGDLLTVGPDLPRHTGTGVLLEGEATNECGQWWSSVGAGVELVENDFEWGEVQFNRLSGQTATWHRAAFWNTTLVAGQKYGVSAYVKRGNTNTCAMTIRNNAQAHENSPQFNFETFEATTIATDKGVIHKAVIEPLSDDIYRIGIVYESNTAELYQFSVKTGTDDPNDYMWCGGGQFELDRITSYIPTNGSALTRATDAALAGDPGNGYSIDLDLIPEVKAALQNQGSMIVKLRPKADIVGAACGFVSCSDNPNSILSVLDGGVVKSSDSVVNSVVTATTLYANTDYTCAVVWSDAGYYNVVNGVKSNISAFNPFALGTHLKLHYGNEFPVEYQSLFFWNRPLTAPEVAYV